MNNKFSLSFGIALVFVGILNILLDTSNIILFGLSISTVLFSFINIIVVNFDFKKSEMLFIIPFVFLIFIFCYGDSLMKIDLLNRIINGKFTSVLTIISFGFLFISEFFNYKIDSYKEKYFEMKRIEDEYEYCSIILEQITNYLTNINKKKIDIDAESQSFLDEIEDLCMEKIKILHINGSLLKLEKDYYTLDDFNDVYNQYNDKLNYDKVMNKNTKTK